MEVDSLIRQSSVNDQPGLTSLHVSHPTKIMEYQNDFTNQFFDDNIDKFILVLKQVTKAYTINMYIATSQF